MQTKKIYWGKAVLSFLLVLFLMPLGHAMMILMEHFITGGMLHACGFLMGFAGLAMVIGGVYVSGDTKQTLFGLIGGLLFWTGWVEFLFQYYANRFGTQPEIDPVSLEVVTKPEYLLLPATFGMWMMMMVVYLFCTANGCLFLNWIQRHALRKGKSSDLVFKPMARHVSVVTFMELNMILWTSYLLLMICYDPIFIGDSHPVTLAIAVSCFVGSLFIFRKQLRISSWGANIRMAIATVIVFWVPVEVMGRNDVFQEIWVAPLEHKQEMYAILFSFLAVGVYVIYKAASGRVRHSL